MSFSTSSTLCDAGCIASIEVPQRVMTRYADLANGVRRRITRRVVFFYRSFAMCFGKKQSDNVEYRSGESRVPSKASTSPVDRGQLQQIIAGLAEGVLLLDPDGSIVWANEAALKMHDCERLEQIGGNAAGYRKRFVLRYLNHHVLTAKQYPVARIVKGEHFADLTVEVTLRAGGDFRRVHTVRSLLLTNARGIVESLVLVSKDVTELLSAEERFERTFAANPAPALICRLSDAHYIKVNQGFLDMTGFGSEEVIDHPFRELDVLHEAQQRDEAIRALREHRTIRQQEAMIRVKGGGEKFVIVAGQPIEVNEQPCMLFTFADLHARKQAEESLRQSEERFAKAFRLAPVPMLVCMRDGWKVIEVNEAFAAVSGSPHQDIVGQSISDIGFRLDAKSLRDLDAALGKDFSLRDRDVQLHSREGAVIDGLLSAEPVLIQNEPCVLLVVQDITERKRSEADLISAIETVMKDTSWFSRRVMEKLAQIRKPDGTPGELEALTPRERQVLELMCKGQTDAEIAAILKLSRNTVRNHVAMLYGKLGVNRRSAAVVWGRERGLAAY